MYTGPLVAHYGICLYDGYAIEMQKFKMEMEMEMEIDIDIDSEVSSMGVCCTQTYRIVSQDQCGWWMINGKW